MTRHLGPALALTAVALAALTGCGGGGGGPTATAPKTPTAAEYAAWDKATLADVKSVSKDLAAAYLKDKKFPASPRGLGTMSSGDRIGSYQLRKVTGGPANLTVCVEHVRQGKAWVSNTYYVAPDLPGTMRQDPMSKTKNGGCL